jgi:8-oxo-dGTP pyrophosphatase MutT (NUDIX family)
MGDYDRIIECIKLNLKKELPGLSAQLKMAPTLRSAPDFPQSPNKLTRSSAVLISIYPENNNANTILIKRTVYKGIHSGQVSFPGGKMDDSDKNLIDTAIRESDEEIGLKPENIEVIGTLTPLFIPVSNLLVLPVIATIPKPEKLMLNLQEVEYTIKVELKHLSDPNNKSVKTICINNMPISAPFYAVGEELVWGATAMIISELVELY